MMYTCPVLSLQKISLLYIIAHLNSFSPRVLSLLPAKLRHELMKNVPVADLWWLESSMVRDGVNIETVWSHILSTRMAEDILRSEYRSLLHSVSLSPQATYMEGLGHLLLNGEMLLEGYQNHYQNFMDLVFSVRHCVGIKNWKLFLRCNPHWQKWFLSLADDGAVIPARHYQQYYTKRTSDISLVYLYLGVCHYFPKQVSILSSRFIQSSFWKEKSYPVVLERLRRYFSKVESLSFAAVKDNDQDSSSINNTDAYCDALHFIVSEILASQICHSFQDIEIRSSNNTTLSSLLATIAPFFSNSSSLESRVNHVPYKYLRELSLTSQERTFSDGVTTKTQSALFENISSILQYQQNLESVSLNGINLANPLSTPDNGLHEVLISHIKRINWKHLSFSTLPLTFPLFQSIIETYFSSPSKNKQLLHFSAIQFTENSLPQVEETQASKELSMAKTAFKTLKLSQSYLPVQVMFWFFDKLHHFHLHSLELDSIAVHPNLSLLTAVARHHDLILEKLILSNIRIRHCPIIADDFHLLLRKDKLKVLQISRCHIGETGVLQDITTALSRLYFWPGNIVQVLDLRENKLGAETDTNLKDFFVALFHLRMLQRMRLDISNNDLRPYHFCAVYNMWRLHAHGAKLCQLNCQGNFIEQNQKAFIGQLAQWVFV